MAVALLALFIALGGTATAATVIIKSSKQIRNGVVTGADLRDGTIPLDKLQSAARSAIEAAETSAIEGFRRSGPENVAAGASQRVATLTINAPGTYAIFAKTVLTATQTNAKLFNTGESLGAHCTLDAAGDQDQSRALLGAPGANSPGELSMQITRGLSSPGDVTLTCDVQDARWRASDTSIIAIRVGRAPRQELAG